MRPIVRLVWLGTRIALVGSTRFSRQIEREARQRVRRFHRRQARARSCQSGLRDTAATNWTTADIGPKTKTRPVPSSRLPCQCRPGCGTCPVHTWARPEIARPPPALTPEWVPVSGRDRVSVAATRPACFWSEAPGAPRVDDRTRCWLKGLAKVECLRSEPDSYGSASRSRPPYSASAVRRVFYSCM